MAHAVGREVERFVFESETPPFMLTFRLTPELELLAACCRWPHTAEREVAVRMAAAAVDWDRFDQVVARHRVVGLVHDGLRRADVHPPPAFSARIADKAAKAARTALDMARETIRLQQAFDKAGTPVLFVKGSSLAALAYGDIGLKQSWDIDLLTRPDTVHAGRRLLEQLGYVLISPAGLDDEQLERFVGLSKECVFLNRSLGVHVELHWRLVDNPQFLAGLDLTRTQIIPLAGAALRTLETVPLFAYLCAHGTIHGWARLKWLADVGALLARQSQADTERLYHGTVALGAGRTPGVALVLCHRLFGLPLTDAVLQELAADRMVAALATNALHCIAYGGGGREFQTIFTTAALRIAVSQLFLVRDQRHFWAQARLKWTSAHDRLWLPLPKPLGFIYHLIRLPNWLIRALGRLVRR